MLVHRLEKAIKAIKEMMDEVYSLFQEQLELELVEQLILIPSHTQMLPRQHSMFTTD